MSIVRRNFSRIHHKDGLKGIQGLYFERWLPKLASDDTRWRQWKGRHPQSRVMDWVEVRIRNSEIISIGQGASRMAFDRCLTFEVENWNAESGK